MSRIQPSLRAHPLDCRPLAFAESLTIAGTSATPQQAATMLRTVIHGLPGNDPFASKVRTKLEQSPTALAEPASLTLVARQLRSYATASLDLSEAHNASGLAPLADSYEGYYPAIHQGLLWLIDHDHCYTDEIWENLRQDYTSFPEINAVAHHLQFSGYSWSYLDDIHKLLLRPLDNFCHKNQIPLYSTLHYLQYIDALAGGFHLNTGQEHDQIVSVMFLGAALQCTRKRRIDTLRTEIDEVARRIESDIHTFNLYTAEFDNEDWPLHYRNRRTGHLTQYSPVATYPGNHNRT